MQAVEALVPRTAFRLRRLDMRVVVGVILMLFAIAGTASIVQKARDRVSVLVAARSVEAGEVIKPTDLRVADISVSRGISYLAASRDSEIAGQIAAKPFAPGEILSAESVVTKASLPAGYVAMSVAIKPSRAAAGSLRGGDHVAVISSRYRMAAQTGVRRPDLLLFCFPSPTREANARQALHPIGMTIATTWMQFHNSDPLGAIWLPLGADQRLPLFDIRIEPAENGNGHGDLQP